MSEQHGTVHWNELMTRDVPAAKAYFAEVCGWSFDEMPMPDGQTYHVAKIGDRMIAGMMDMTGMPGMDQTPAHWLTYLAVDDVDAAAEKTRAGGGEVHQAPFDVPNVGRIAVVGDPTGAVVGLMTPSDG